MTTAEKQKHPEGLYVLFMVEMWERFSFYGMRALLTLYMLKMLLYGQTEAFGIYGAYGALVYLTPLLGGYLADNYLGYRRAIYTGGILMAAGMFMLVLNQEFLFFYALAIIILGNGFFKPNISSMVGKLYEPGDPRRDSGFSIFYMGINLGAFLAPIGCSLVGEVFGYHYGFMLAGIGMMFGLALFARKMKIFGDNGTPPNLEFLKKASPIGLPYSIAIPVAALLLLPVLAFLVNHHDYVTYLVFITFAIFAVILTMDGIKRGKVALERIFVIIILVLFSFLFWSFFEMAGSALTVYADINVDRGSIPAALFQAVNPFFILVFVPIFNMLWAKLAEKKLEPNTGVKFALGLLQLGIGFFMFVIGSRFANELGLVPLVFLLLGYFFHTTGEICLSPVGLSMVTKLAPPQIVGMVMGFWFMSSALAHNVSGKLAVLTAVGGDPIQVIAYDPIYDKFKAKSDDQFYVYATVKGEGENAKAIVTDSVLVKIGSGAGATKFADLPYQKFVAGKPGAKIEFSLKYPLLDKDGQHSVYAVVGAGRKGKLAINGDKGVYTPDSAFTGRDTVQYSVCDNRAEQPLCDNIQVVVTADPAEAHLPKALVKEIQLNPEEYTHVPDAYGLELNFLGYQKYKAVKITHNNLFVDADLDVDPKGVNFNVKSQELSEAQKKDARGVIVIKKVDDPRLSPRRTLLIYDGVFQLITYVALGVGVLLLILSPLIKKWMHEDKFGEENKA